MIFRMKFGDPWDDGHGTYVEVWFSTPDIKFLEEAEKEVQKQWGERFFEGFAHEPEEAWLRDEVWQALFEADFPVNTIFETCDIEEEMPWKIYPDVLIFGARGNHNNLSIECVVEMYIWLMNYHGARLTKIPDPFKTRGTTVGYGCFEF